MRVRLRQHALIPVPQPIVRDIRGEEQGFDAEAVLDCAAVVAAEDLAGGRVVCVHDHPDASGARCEVVDAAVLGLVWREAEFVGAATECGVGAWVGGAVALADLDGCYVWEGGDWCDEREDQDRDSEK